MDRPSEVTSTDLNQSKYSFEALVVMRNEFPEIDDETLARFLIARNGDTSKSIPMLQSHLEWKSNSANWPVLKASVEEEGKKGKLYCRGFDKDNHPVFIWNSRYHSSSDRDMDTVVRLAVWWLEYGIKRLPAGKSKLTFVLNRVGAKADSSDIELAKNIMKLFSDNFPERLFTVIVYPSGLVFYGVWNIVRFFLDPVTQAKVRPVLQLAGVEEFIDRQWIPKVMGGDDDYEFNFDDFEDP